METRFQLITNAEDLRREVAQLATQFVIGFDTETTSLDPYQGVIRLIQFSSAEGVRVIDLNDFPEPKTNPDLQPLRDFLETEKTLKVAHNAKFDAKWLKHHLGVETRGLFDTFLASQLIAAGDSEKRHSLAAVALEYLGVELDKSQQISDWSAELSSAQIEYAAKDAEILLPLYQKVSERLETDGLTACANLEFDALMPILSMELDGMFLDKARWREQLERVKKEQFRLADELQEMLSGGVAQGSLFGRSEINLDSQAQVSDALKNLGVPIPETTRGWQLQPLANDYPVIAKLLEYRSMQKSLTSYGENILEFIKPETGRIHADFRQIAAPSGRMACSNPNLQQVPHGTEYRRCFRAPDGKKLVVADYSQIELRILAEFSEDENFIKAFVSGADFHKITAAQVFGISLDEVTSDQRAFAKRLNFGVVYGIGASRFALVSGLSVTEAENLMKRYFTTYRKLDTWLREAAARGVRDRSMRTASGRLAKFRFDSLDRQAVSATQRNAKNLPIQGTSADILKRALRLLHNEFAGTSAKIVNVIHDEIVVECDANEAEEIAIKVEKAMISAAEEFVKKVPILVDANISDEWAK